MKMFLHFLLQITRLLQWIPANPLGLIQGNFTVVHLIPLVRLVLYQKMEASFTASHMTTAGRLVGVVSNFNSQSYAATIIRDALGRKTNVDNNGLLSVINLRCA
jgi:hypothetical protein